MFAKEVSSAYGIRNMRKKAYKLCRAKSSILWLIKASIVLALVMLMLTTTACQPTPEEVIVVGKDQEKMIEKAQNDAISDTKQATEEETETSVSPIEAPDIYAFNTTGAKGKLIVAADATVTIPDAEQIPTLEVTPETFSQEMISGILEYLFEDTPLYETNSDSEVLTKDEIETAIISLQADIASGRFDEDGDLLEAAKDRITLLETMYDSAPETKDGPVLFTGQVQAELSIFSMNNVTGDWIATFECGVSNSSGDDRIKYIDYRAMGGKDVIFTMDGALKVDADSDISDDLSNNLGITLQDANKLAQDFFDATDLSFMNCRASYVIDDHGTGNVDGYIGDAKNHAFKLYYTRTIENSPVLVLGTIGEDRTEEYDYLWAYERLEILITKKGIAEIDWVSPCLASEVITDKTNIITFDEATKIFENKIMTIYEAKVADIFKEGIENNLIESIDISVDSIQLGLLRIKQQNTAGEKYGLYVPVWAFYGTVTYNYTDAAWEYGIPTKFYNDGVQYPEGPYIVLAINAIDESLIDISLGY